MRTGNGAGWDTRSRRAGGPTSILLAPPPPQMPGPAVAPLAQAEDLMVRPAGVQEMPP